MEMENIIDLEGTCVLGTCASLEPRVYKIVVHSAGEMSIYRTLGQQYSLFH